MIFSNYRSHAHFIAHNGNYKKMWAELYGKKTGLSSGKAGSMHLGDLKANFMFTSAIVASSISEAVGYSLAIKMKKSNKRVICYHGEGAVDQGSYWESINFAVLKKLPIIFICENNQYAIYSHQKNRMAKNNICQKAKTFGIKTKFLKSHCTKKIFESTKEALKSVDMGKGPMLIEIMTTRIMDHVGVDNDSSLGYKTKQYYRFQKKYDELDNLKKKTNKFREIDEKINKEIKAAINFAENSSFPRTLK